MAETIKAFKSKLKESQKVSYRLPTFEHAHVSDAMRKEFFSCEADDLLRTVARLMASHHIHCVVVERIHTAGRKGIDWGIVTDRDLMKNAGRDDDLSAGEIATREAVMTLPEEPLTHATQLMTEHDTTHLVVLDPITHRPVGVLSGLDIAGVLAWGRG